MSGRPESEPRHSFSSEEPAAAWQLRDVVLGLAVLSTLIFIQLFLGVTGLRPDHRLGLEAEVFRFFPTVLTGYGVLWLARRRGMTLGDLGFNRRRIVWPAFLAWFLAIASGPIVLGAWSLAAIGSGVPRILLAPAVLALGIGMVVVAPLVEEITFRGLLFRGLRDRWPVLPAAFLSGLIFAAFHFDAATLIPLTITGMAFAWAYDRTGSIWASILPHAGLNALAFIVLIANRT